MNDSGSKFHWLGEAGFEEIKSWIRDSYFVRGLRLIDFMQLLQVWWHTFKYNLTHEDSLVELKSIFCGIMHALKSSLIRDVDFSNPPEKKTL